MEFLADVCCSLEKSASMRRLSSATILSTAASFAACCLMAMLQYLVPCGIWLFLGGMCALLTLLGLAGLALFTQRPLVAAQLSLALFGNESDALESLVRPLCNQIGRGSMVCLRKLVESGGLEALAKKLTALANEAASLPVTPEMLKLVRTMLGTSPAFVPLHEFLIVFERVNQCNEHDGVANLATHLSRALLAYASIVLNLVPMSDVPKNGAASGSSDEKEQEETPKC